MASRQNKTFALYFENTILRRFSKINPTKIVSMVARKLHLTKIKVLRWIQRLKFTEIWKILGVEIWWRLPLTFWRLECDVMWRLLWLVGSSWRCSLIGRNKRCSDWLDGYLVKFKLLVADWLLVEPAQNDEKIEQVQIIELNNQFG